MKKIAIIFSLLFLTFAIFSCDNAKDEEETTDKEKTEKTKLDSPEDYAKEMIQKIEDFTDLLVEVGEDGIISDDEVTKLEEMGQEVDEFEAELKEKFGEDEEAQAKMDEIVSENAELEEAFFAAYMALFECEGADKLQ